MHQIIIKRIYELKEEDDGFRILVDGLWPRGMKKEDAMIDRWAKEIAPSKEIRKTFNHDPEKFEWFKDAYKKELKNNPDASAFKDMINEILQDKPVSLLYAARDEKHNHAAVLKKWMRDKD